MSKSLLCRFELVFYRVDHNFTEEQLPGNVLAPLRVPPHLVLHNVHHQRPHLVVPDDGVELAEGGEAEEGVDDVGRQVDRGLPLFPEIGKKMTI